MSFQYSDNYVKQKNDDQKIQPATPVSTNHVDHHPVSHAETHPGAHVIMPADLSREYKKLAAVFGLVALCATIMSFVLGFDWQEWMRWFMAGFFVIFGSFKLIGYENFIASFPQYNVLARRFKPYNYTYPFIELFLGFFFAADLSPVFRNSFTLVIMTIGVYSISRALAKPDTIACVCLGNVIKLPLSTISLLEEGLMAAMAIIMLITYFVL